MLDVKEYFSVIVGTFCPHHQSDMTVVWGLKFSFGYQPKCPIIK